MVMESNIRKIPKDRWIQVLDHLSPQIRVWGPHKVKLIKSETLRDGKSKQRDPTSCNGAKTQGGSQLVTYIRINLGGSQQIQWGLNMREQLLLSFSERKTTLRKSTNTNQYSLYTENIRSCIEQKLYVLMNLLHTYLKR